MKFNVHKNDGDFSDGLRGLFEYRDLGISDATDGKVNAHVIRALPGHEKDGSGIHFHNLDFQMVYILKGWVIFRFCIKWCCPYSLLNCRYNKYYFYLKCFKNY